MTRIVCASLSGEDIEKIEYLENRAKGFKIPVSQIIKRAIDTLYQKERAVAQALEADNTETV